jgi:hypothetical protein
MSTILQRLLVEKQELREESILAEAFMKQLNEQADELQLSELKESQTVIAEIMGWANAD